MKRGVWTFSLLAVLLLAPHAGATDDDLITFKETIARAFEHNHELKAFGYSISVAQEEVGIARSFLLPKIRLEERFMRTNNLPSVFTIKLKQQRFTAADFDVSSLNNPNATNNFQTTFSIEQPILLQQANVSFSMAKTELAAENNDPCTKEGGSRLQGHPRAPHGLHGKGTFHVAEQAIDDAREHCRISGLKYNAGLGLYSDVLRTLTALTAAEQRAVTSRKNFDVAKRALGILLGKDSPVDIAAEPVITPLLGLGYYVSSSLSRKDIVSAPDPLRECEKLLKLTQASYFPYIGIGGSYQMNDSRLPFGAEGSSWFVTAFLRWDLFDGTKRYHEVSKARYQVAQTGEKLDGMRKAISFKVNEAYLGVDEAKKTRELAQCAAKTAEDGRLLVRTRFEAALAPLVDLVDSQTNFDLARANLVASENNYALAIAQLAFESGTLLKDLNAQ